MDSASLRDGNAHTTYSINRFYLYGV